MIKLDSTLKGHRPKRALEGITVVDVDVHIHESPEALAPYCEMPWRKSLEFLETVPKRYLDIPGFAANMSPFAPFPDSGGKRRNTVTSAGQMREDLDELGVDIGILFPDHFLTLAILAQAPYAVALARAYNRWMTEEWLNEDRGLKGALIAPSQDPIAAAEEIRHYADHPHVSGVFLPTCAVDPLYGHRSYNPMFEAAQECGLPVFLHSVQALHPVFPFNTNRFETVFGAHSIIHSFSIIVNLVSMMETGVPVRFPNLKIVFTEGGLGWVPWIMLRMDKEYLERRRDVPFLKERPSHYVQQMYFATQPIEEPEHLKDMATLFSLFHAENHVLFASDWPHHDFDHPSKVLQIPLSREVQRKIMGGNALRLLKLEEPAR
jgi:predicted TIM-barrel fold metal-dependent hydrolase